MAENDFEIWVIDSNIFRRLSFARKIMDLGYLTFHVDPIENPLGIYARPVVAMVHDDGHSVDRILDYRHKRLISCVVYSGRWTARRACDLLRQGVVALMDWPCQSQEVADALAAAGGLPAHVDSAWSGAIARNRSEALSCREREVL